MSAKVDFRKTLKDLYHPQPGGFHIVDVPAMNFLMIDGCGNPNLSAEYQKAVESLYALSYAIMFSLKKEGKEYVVPPLEGLWWMENMVEFTLANKDRWKWTMMIMQPEWVTSDRVKRVREQVFAKKKLPSLLEVYFDTYPEGLSLQVLYTGAYENEAPLIAEMHQYIHAHGFSPSGKHHEIYLGDPRKTPAEKLRTILRQPIKPEKDSAS